MTGPEPPLQFRQEHLKNLYEDLKLAFAQLDSETDNVKRGRIQRHIKEIEQEIEQAESELEQLEHKKDEHSPVTPFPSRIEKSDEANTKPSLGERLRHSLWFYYLVGLLLSVLGFIANLGQVMGLSLCQQLCLFAGLAGLGGFGILLFSLWPDNRQNYQDWDRLATVVFAIALTSLLIWRASQHCSNQCPQVQLELSPKLVSPGGEVKLVAQASDPENDPLVYYWQASLPGLQKEGGPYQGSQNIYVAPQDSWGARIEFVVTIDDNHCGKKIAAKEITQVVLAPPATPSRTPTRTAPPTPSSTPTPTLMLTPTPTLTLTPTATLMPTPTPTGTLCPVNILTPPPPVAQRWEKSGSMMVYIPAGEFVMGSSDSDTDAESDEKPHHRVYLDTFWIDQTEVTNAQYDRCVQAGVCRKSFYADNTQYNDNEQPIIGVTWDDAHTYCGWTERTLPTEAQWEKAARGPDCRLYAWGNQNATCQQAVIREQAQKACGKNAAWPVGSSLQDTSFYGAQDMSGNVWEWVADWYDPNHYQYAPAANPTGPDAGSERVIRGGSWLNDYKWARAAHRHSMLPSYNNTDLGFRCVALGWGTYTDKIGSTISPTTLLGPAFHHTIHITFNLKAGGWVGVFQDIAPSLLTGVSSIGFTYSGSGAPNTIELKLLYMPDSDGKSAVFSTLWHNSTDTKNQTRTLEADLDKFGCWAETGCTADEKLDPKQVGRIDFAISNKGETGDIASTGTLTITNIHLAK